MLQLPTDKEEIKLAHRKQDCTLCLLPLKSRRVTAALAGLKSLQKHMGQQGPLWSLSLSASSARTWCLTYFIFPGSSVCLQKKKRKFYTPVSTCWHLQMFLCSQKLHHFTLKLFAGIYHFACHRFTFYLYLNYMHSNTEVTSI